MRPIFLPYVSIADMLTQTFGSDCEVVLHDLNDPEHSVVYVSNGTVTRRRPGDSFDQLVRQVILSDGRKDDYAANYYFTAPNGKRIRSSTVFIRDADGSRSPICNRFSRTGRSRSSRRRASISPS